MYYKKPATEIQKQIEILIDRNLAIPSKERASKYLKTVGYYRLSGYMYHLQQADSSHIFKDGTDFDDIINTYTFDKKLRFLTLSYLERIEVAMRSLIINTYSVEHDFFWYKDSIHFDKPPEIPLDISEKVDSGKIVLPRKYINTHNYIMDSISDGFKTSSNLFITNFKRKYTSESLPPCNMVLELVSMGCISRMYDSLVNSKEKQKIAAEFDLAHNLLSSWLIYLTNVRNICAHHSRLWNRKMTADRFLIPTREKFKFKGSVPDNFDSTYYGALSIMIRLLNKINPSNSLLCKFHSLLKEYPKINVQFMGFPIDWEENPAWISQEELK